jgi:murein DD-endopeptidase MepM/ murein hydrolase activator NlpD
LLKPEMSERSAEGIGGSVPRPLAFAAGLGFLMVLAAYLLIQRSQPYGMPRPLTAIRPANIVAPPPVLNEVSGTFRQNQTITDALTGHGLPSEQVLRMVKGARPVFNLARVSANRPYWLYFRQDGEFNDFRYAIDDQKYLTVYRHQGAFVPVVKEFVYETRVEPVSGVIEDSLIGCMTSRREHEMLALQLADIFMYDIDFYADIQKGDSFRLLVEKKYDHERFVKYGPIIAAEIQNQGRTYRGFRFTDENGAQAYFSAGGDALKRSFLKSPLKFAKVSSRFARSRFHPILKIFRPHMGVDYAASIGTAVQAVGAGVVVTAGSQGASGRMVKLRHPGGYETMYLHLSKIAVRAGDRIGQGDTIGYVGSSGLSTGPHLDFRILNHGTFINPMKVIFPPNPPLAGAQRDRFEPLRNDLQSQLDRISLP